MSRKIPQDRPLSEEDRAYLLMRGEDARVKWFDATFPAGNEEEEPELDDSEEEDEDEELTDGYEDWNVSRLQARIKELNDEGAEISPASGRKDDLITALREYDALPDEPQ